MTTLLTFEPTPIPGAFVVRAARRADERGWFGRVFCRDAFAAAGLESSLAQVSLSHSRRRGTLRGLHLQRPPHAEAKLVRCVAGRVHDVIADLRDDSPARRRWHSIELADGDDVALYVPPGVAHGFQTLTDDVTLLYLMSAPHAPEHATGVRFDDPALDVAWPEPVTAIHERDRTWPLL